MSFYCGTRIEVPPTFAGTAGSAWQLHLAPPGARARKDYDGTVAVFLVRAPGRHVLWDHWLMSVIHLRDIAGVRPPHKAFAAATHEVLITALDPGHPLPALTVDADWAPRCLRPLDLVEQVALTGGDVAALRLLELAVQAVVVNGASPDSDWRAWWRRALADGAQGLNEGRHDVPGMRPS